MKKLDNKTKNFKIKKLVIGDKFYTYDRMTLCHIINFFEDNNIMLVTFKCWNNSRGWIYHTEPLELLLFQISILYDNMSDKSNPQHVKNRKKFFELNNIEYN